MNCDEANPLTDKELCRFRLKKTPASGWKIEDQEGAVTVDWLVITAAIVVLGTVVVAGITGGLTKVSSEIDTELSAVSIS